MRATFYKLLTAFCLLTLSACGPDRTPDYRYRLTVEVDTPQGLVSGYSVIEVQQTLGRDGASPIHQMVHRRVRGEAVAVELPDGRTLYALLRGSGTIDWASMVYVYLGTVGQQPETPRKSESFEGQLDNVLELTGERVLPRMWPPVGHLNERSAYPMLVTFADERDPTSVALVDPDDLAASFGEGVSLKRITVELTDDPVTTGIVERLGWLPEYYDKMLDGQRLNTIYTDNRLANDLSQGSFSKGVLQ